MNLYLDSGLLKALWRSHRPIFCGRLPIPAGTLTDAQCEALSTGEPGTVVTHPRPAVKEQS